MAPAQHPLLLPEILRTIMPLLSRRDLLESMRVCSTWNLSLNPLLWETVPLPQRWKIQKYPSLCPSAETLHQNAHHIRHLLCWDLYLIDKLIPECTMLENLDMFCIGPQVPILMRQSCRTLSKVSLKRDPLQYSAISMEDLLDAVAKCSWIERLVLNDIAVQRDRTALMANNPNNGDEGAASKESIVQEFYRTVQGIPHLELINATVMEPPTPVMAFSSAFTPLTPADVAAIPSASSPYASPDFIPSLPKIQTLKLIRNQMNLLDQTRLLHNCSNLVALTWQLRGTTNLVHDLSPDLHFTFLKLSYLDISWSTLLDADIAAVLGRMPHLTRLRLHRTYIGPLSCAAIVGPSPLGTGGNEGDVNETNENAGPLHGMRDQLVELDITDCENIISEQILTILLTCNRLKVFSASMLTARDIVDSPHGDWVCQNLEHLTLSIVGVPLLSTMEEQHKIMEQLGRLKHLKTLSFLGKMTREMRIWKQSLNLTLASGLDKLRTLSQLQDFEVGSLKHRMDRPEYEWMSKHWTSLREFKGELCPNAEYKDEEGDMKEYLEELMPEVTFRRRVEE